MKKGILVGLGLLVGMFAIDAQAAASFNVSARQEKNTVVISFSTKEHMSSMCYLTTTKVEMEREVGFGALNNLDGRIEVTASHNPRTMCLMAFGPHRGSVNFERGLNLPTLADGRYRFILNGESYGTLNVTKSGVILEE